MQEVKQQIYHFEQAWWIRAGESRKVQKLARK